MKQKMVSIIRIPLVGLSLVACIVVTGAADASDAHRLVRAATTATNILVNDRSTDTFPFITQSETTAAVVGNQVVIAFDDFADRDPTCFVSTVVGCSNIGYARSLNGGVTWTDMGHLPVPSGDAVALVQEPVVVADRSRHAGEAGVFYLATVAVNASIETIIGVYKTVDAGATWAPAVNASALAPGEFQDSPWTAVDTRSSGAGAGNVYVCWDSFDLSGNRTIEFARSTDGGATFEQLPGGITSGTVLVSQCRLAVDPVGGEVYVTWVDFDSAPIAEHHFRRSTDGGASFAPEVTVAEFEFAATLSTECPDAAPLVPVYLDSEADSITRAVRTIVAPSIAVNPVTRDVYIVREQPGLPGGAGADIGVSVSHNGGSDWSAPARINRTVTGHQFFPSIAVNSAGEIRVMYDSTQNSPSDRLIDVYQVVSKDAVTWSDPMRVTSVSFDRPPTNPDYEGGRFCYMGDYNHITAAAPGLGGKNFYLAWSDNRLDGDPNTPGVQPDPDIRAAVVRPAPVGGVCGYTVSRAFGARCPIRAGDTICRSVSAVTGACDATLSCYRGGPFACLATWVPKSGPQQQCPFASKRPTGFNCFAR